MLCYLSNRGSCLWFVSILRATKFSMSLQYNQRVRSAIEKRAQAVPCEGAIAAPQGEMPIALPRAAGLLCRAVPREGRYAYGTCSSRPPQVLAQDLLTERGQCNIFKLLVVIKPLNHCNSHFEFCDIILSTTVHITVLQD